MTRQLEPNQEMGRFIADPINIPNIQKEIGYIVSLFQFKNVQLKVIGDQFLQNVWQKDPTTTCLCLLALYEELNAIIHVTQRLLICYLIYRQVKATENFMNLLKDVWKLDGTDKAGMFSHPYLLIFVKIYWNYVSPPGTNIKDRSLLHLLGEFPKITPQEACFVGRILTSPPHVLKELFDSSPTIIASDPIGNDQTINIEPLKVFVEQELRQFPFFEAVVQSTSTGLPPRQNLSFNNPSLFPSLQKIVLSLVSPSAANASLNNNHLNNRNVPPGPPMLNPNSRRNIINLSYGYFSTPPSTPPGLRPPSSTAPNMPAALAKLFNSSTSSPNNSPTKSLPKPLGFFGQKVADVGDDIDKLNQITFGDLDPTDTSSIFGNDRLTSSMFSSHDSHSHSQNTRMSPVASISSDFPPRNSLSYVPDRDRPMPDPIGTPLPSKRKPQSKTPSQADRVDQEAVENRKFAFDTLKKIVEGHGSSLSKTQVTRLLNVLISDKEILPMVEVTTHEFGQIVESQPDLAAEVLVQLHAASSLDINDLLEVLLSVELSVQSLITVSRFINTCERNSLNIPNEFLNTYITHCIKSCEEGTSKPELKHRLVRMVCVFFSTLIRLSSFNIRPRLNEMQNFATVFTGVKETSQLYQAITQMNDLMASELTDRPFLAYLCQLEEELVKRLYQSEVCCLGIYRILPAVSQQCVAMMIFNSRFNILRQCSADLLNVVRDNLLLLQTLHIIEGEDDDLMLNTDFKFNYLHTTMKGVIKTSDVSIMEEMDERGRKAASKDLFKKAIERWECVLSYLALPSENSIQAIIPNVSQTTRDLFQHIGFNRSTGDDFEITSLGFQFLLLSRTEQIWTYIVYYFKFIQVNHTAELFQHLEFFFRLSLCVTPNDFSDGGIVDGENAHISTPYLTNEDWPESVHKFLIHLRELGLVFIRKRKDGYFFLTPLFASTVASDNLQVKDLVMDAGRDKGFLVTETNYRISAYTNSNLHLSILSTFTKLLLRFDTFVVAHMTRETVQEAFHVGITARQITQFLRSNAHRKTIEAHGHLHCVPPTVIDQIHLWEEERDRLNTQDCVVLSMFNSEQEYRAMRDFSAEKNILLYDDTRQKVLVVSDEGYEHVRAWRKQQT